MTESVEENNKMLPQKILTTVGTIALGAGTNAMARATLPQTFMGAATGIGLGGIATLGSSICARTLLTKKPMWDVVKSSAVDAGATVTIMGAKAFAAGTGGTIAVAVAAGGTALAYNYVREVARVKKEMGEAAPDFFAKNFMREEWREIYLNKRILSKTLTSAGLQAGAIIGIDYLANSDFISNLMNGSIFDSIGSWFQTGLSKISSFFGNLFSGFDVAAPETSPAPNSVTDPASTQETEPTPEPTPEPAPTPAPELTPELTPEERAHQRALEWEEFNAGGRASTPFVYEPTVDAPADTTPNTPAPQEGAQVPYHLRNLLSPIGGGSNLFEHLGTVQPTDMLDNTPAPADTAPAPEPSPVSGTATTSDPAEIIYMTAPEYMPPNTAGNSTDNTVAPEPGQEEPEAAPIITNPDPGESRPPSDYIVLEPTASATTTTPTTITPEAEAPNERAPIVLDDLDIETPDIPDEPQMAEAVGTICRGEDGYWQIDTNNPDNPYNMNIHSGDTVNVTEFTDGGTYQTTQITWTGESTTTGSRFFTQIVSPVVNNPGATLGDEFNFVQSPPFYSYEMAEPCLNANDNLSGDNIAPLAAVS